MAVPNLPAYKSDPLTISPNPKETNVFAEGSLTLSGFIATTGGYVATASVTLSTGDKGTANIPVSVVAHYIAYGSGVYHYRNAPYTYFSDYSLGTVNNSMNVTIVNQLITGTTYEVTLTVTYFTKDNSVAIRDSAYYTQTVYYKLYTSSYGNTA